MSERTIIEDAEHTTDLFVGVLAKAMASRVLEDEFDGQVTMAQLQALRYLARNDQRLMSDLAEGLAISYPAATKTVERLVKKDLVSRAGDPADRRVVRVRLTEAGIGMVKRIDAELNRRLSIVLERLNEADREALLRGMSAFIAAALAGVEDEKTLTAICTHCGDHHSGDCPVAGARVRVLEQQASAV
ncbi:MAG: MarR family winged helix-turn-helix transcriptional regulator [Chloroflexota bacterium]